MSNKIENKFVFILGREQNIALAELKTTLTRLNFCFDIYKITGNLAFANIDNFTKDDAKNLSGVLGGTIKICRLLTGFWDKKSLIGNLKRLLLEEKTGTEHKINFGISDFSKAFQIREINEIGIKIKTYLKKDLKLRFVGLQDSSELSSIVSLKNKLLDDGLEFCLFNEGIGVLIGLSNAEEWSIRDYEKPASDKFSGMVPPKLAREMTNLALGEVIKKDEKCLVVDPFCGSGNILMEAMLLGCDILGSDLSLKAVDDSKKNIEWARQKYQNVSEIKSRISNLDATKDHLLLDCQDMICSSESVAIVTEPYLGEPKKFKPTYNAARGEYSKIKILILDFLKNLANDLKNCSIAGVENGVSARSKHVVCLIFPLVETLDRGQFSLFGQSVDEIRKLGYTQVRNSFIYGRDYQVVKREIVLLQAKQE